LVPASRVKEVMEMAKKVTVSLIDDFDGKQADGTVQFGLDGVSYEIDLSEKNAKKMREGLRPWVDAGRESEDLGGGAQSARAAYQLTASKAPKFVNGHAKAVMRSPAAAGSQPRCSTLIGPPSSAKIAAAAPAGIADSVEYPAISTR